MKRIVVYFVMVTALLAAGAGDSLPAPCVDTGSGAFFRYLLSIGHCDEAALEYERLLYTGAADTCSLSCDLGEAYLKKRRADRAEALFERAIETADGPTQKAAAARGLLRAYLMNRKPALAQSELNGLDSATAAALGDETRVYLAGLMHATAYRVDSARKTFRLLAPQSPMNASIGSIDSLLSWYRSQELKNPLYAFLYSSAIPGWGHWYVGDRKKAIASCALMAGLSGLLCYEGYRFYRGNTQERYVRGMDMFLIWGLAWRRYYNGVRKAAHQRAVEKNRAIQVEYQERLHRILAQE